MVNFDTVYSNFDPKEAVLPTNWIDSVQIRILQRFWIYKVNPIRIFTEKYPASVPCKQAID